MNRFAALLMAIACLLYAGMPAWSVPAKAAPVAAITTPSDHGVAHDMAAMDHAQHSGKRSKPCPHGGEGCVTPFCAACLVVLPDPAFQPLNTFAFSYPAPSPAQKMIAHAPALHLPPPRA